MKKVQIPDSANTDIKVSLGGKTYNFRYNYNSTSGSYYLDILYQNEVIISSLKLVENVPLVKKYALDDFEHGDLMMVRLKETEASPGRNNVGVNKAYELIYISNEELSEV